MEHSRCVIDVKQRINNGLINYGSRSAFQRKLEYSYTSPLLSQCPPEAIENLWEIAPWRVNADNLVVCPA